MDFAYTNRICGVGDSKDDEKKGQKLIVDFTIGIFFDGTCNNKYNFQYARDAHKDFDKDNYGSYHGSFTNVAQMWFLYDASGEYTKKIYVEGPGTAKPIEVKEKNRYKDEDDFMSSGKKDSDMAAASGSGELGINAKIERGCKQIKKKIYSMFQKDKFFVVNSITLDVFGFSRGAASARRFVSCLWGAGNTKTEGYKVSLMRDYLNDMRFAKTEVAVRFLGLFDTVSSYECLHGKIEREAMTAIRDRGRPMSFNLLPEAYYAGKSGVKLKFRDFTNDVSELGLSIPEGVKHVVHLVAANEYRGNFALTTVDTAKGLGANCIEYVLPGAHSDIGGGYPPFEKEYLYQKEGLPRMSEVNDPNSRAFIGCMPFAELFKRRWINDFLYKFALEQYKLTSEIDNRLAGRRYSSVADLPKCQAPYRVVRNDYAKIPLDIMYRYAKLFLLPLQSVQGVKGKNNAVVEKVLIIPDTEDDPDLKLLKRVGNAIMKKAMARQRLYAICNDGIYYVYKGTDVDVLSIRRKFIHLSATVKDLFEPHVATKNCKRTIIRDNR